MKKITIILSIAAAASVLMSCNDEFLDLTPLTSINDGNFWKTDQDLQTYVNGMYSYVGASTFDQDQKSDNLMYKTKNKYIWDTNKIPASGGSYQKSDFVVMRNCNYFLSHFKKAVGDQAVIDACEGSVRLVRASNWFAKVVLFGDMPWYTKEVNVFDKEILYGKRLPRKQVVDTLLAELDKAAELLPESAEGEKFSRYAALALKARIALYEGTHRKYWNEGDAEAALYQCKAACEEIMNSGKYDLHPDYRGYHICRDLGTSKEAIYYKVIDGVNNTNGKPRNSYMDTWGITQDLVETFVCSDGKPIGVSELYKGDDTFEDMITDRDPRLTMLIYDGKRPFKKNAAGEGEVIEPVNWSSTDWGYMIWKVYSEEAIDQDENTCDIDMSVYRYGEILISYAECMAELGLCTQDVLDATVNKLRKRAGLDAKLTVDVGFTDPNWPDFESMNGVEVSPLIQEIRRERRVELCLEGRRWYDIVRWKAGPLVNNPKTYQGAKWYAKGETDYHKPYKTSVRKWSDRCYFYPIPKNQLTLNPELKQNPGWE
ncbi:MAG: RagB/SusD family nutrient uptake outer membrane protein [Candidatus Cryptobacteroides sp.]